ncbi:hypothetical protein H8M03_05615 [Sphingomonas sabuli]|uniref:Uncharacterized protein n=1 Tax=Sphingomonas sabuli TaxID=2764186 RepID=A0A7G9L599_9SPHN|nr:hypothetical protein [Sphingomonas sabuli]QNM83798.1 hypothetical protein H8M03_05615 [Sphingomonas sabuli]
MATIDLNPEVEDYFVKLTLEDIQERGGIADLFEEGRLILLRRYRLPFDYKAIARLSNSLDKVKDRVLKKKLKKLTSLHFFEGEPPVRRNDTLIFSDRVRQAMFDVICRGDIDRFERASTALRAAHEEALRLFGICFPDYQPFRLEASVRLSRTLFENLHWDNHSIDDDFHQARIFANLDTRPRIWSVGEQFPTWVRNHYDEYDLGRFAGRDPNEMLQFITSDVLGGTRKTWMDHEPRHRVAFDPGEVWIGESRLISHQINYGDAALVYMWFVTPESMANKDNRFNARVDQIHREMADRVAA